MAIRLDLPWLLEEQEEEHECYENGLILPHLRIEGYSEELEMKQKKEARSLVQFNSRPFIEDQLYGSRCLSTCILLEPGRLPERKVKRKVLLRYP